VSGEQLRAMKAEQATAGVELRFGDKSVRVKALVDTGASKSMISKELADELGAFVPLAKPYELRTADEGGRLRIIGYCRLEVAFQGVEVPGGRCSRWPRTSGGTCSWSSAGQR